MRTALVCGNTKITCTQVRQQDAHPAPYTEIDIRVLFTLDGNDKGLGGHSKKICKPRFNTDIRKCFLKSSH